MGHPSKPLVPVPFRTGTKGVICTGSGARSFSTGSLEAFVPVRVRNGTKGFRPIFPRWVGPGLDLWYRFIGRTGTKGFLHMNRTFPPPPHTHPIHPSFFPLSLSHF